MNYKLSGAFLSVALAALMSSACSDEQRVNVKHAGDRSEWATSTLSMYDPSLWLSWGGDPGQTRYAPLDEINTSTVDRLKVAWRWSADTSGLGASNNFKATPLLHDGILYVPWMNHGVAAIEAGTGKTVWTFEPGPADGRSGAGSLNSRGLAYWTNGDAKRVFHNTLDGRLLSIDADTGLADQQFGKNGWLDLRDDLDDTRPKANVRSVSPALVVGDVVVVQVLPAETVNKEATPGNIRGFDARTGALLWTFHVVPRAGETGNETWEDGSWQWAGNSGTWSMMSADPALGYVYIPTDTPSNDFSGVDRPGDNLFAESILVLDARTGKRVWHFQAVHHGLWDYDNPAAPILHDVVRNGERIQVATLLTKQNLIFTFDRATGEPIWPIEERPVPPSTVPGEKASPTQPFPTRPAPLSKVGYDEDMLIDFTPELRAEAVKIMDGYAKGPFYLPPVVAGENGLRGTWLNPGYGGGAEWTGGAFDPETGILYVPIRHKPYSVAVTKGDPARTNYAYVQSGNHVVMGPNGLPILKPPYSEVVAVDMNSGEHLWRIPIGGAPDFIRNNTALKGLDLDFDQMGQYDIRPGILLTRDMFFMGESGSLPGQTGGPMFRAYDKRNGAVVWEYKMPSLVTGAPMTYTHNGRQYVVVAVSENGKPAELIALTLDGSSDNGASPSHDIPASAAPQSRLIDPTSLLVTPAELALGESTFAKACAACHGANGAGNIGPSLTGRNDLANIGRVVKEGQGQMPPMTGQLTSEEIDAVSKYIVKSLTPEPPAGRN